MEKHAFLIRRNAMYKLLSDLQYYNLAVKENLKTKHGNADEQVTTLLKSITSRDFREPPGHSWLAKFPVWETVCVACRYANITGWDMPHSRIIQGYLPNNDKEWLDIFHIKWDALRVLDTTSGEELLNLLKK